MIKRQYLSWTTRIKRTVNSWLAWLWFKISTGKRVKPKKRWKGYIKYAGKKMKFNCKDISEVINTLSKLRKESEFTGGGN